MSDSENPLSKREQEILTLVARGMTNQEIAHALVISPNTVKVHVRNIFAKLEAASRTEATIKAAQAGWIQVAGLATEEAGEPAPLPAPIEPPLPTWQRVYFFVAALVVLAALLAPGLLDRLRAATPTSDLSDAALSRLGAPARSAVGRWESLASLPTARSRLAVTAHDGLLYAIGGEGPEAVTGAVDVYDPKTNGWLPRSDKPTAVANAQAAALDGLIFVPGGTAVDGAASQVLEVYDPLADRWDVRQPLPLPLAGYAMAALNGQLYLFGGWNGSAYVDTLLVYDVARDEWSTRSPLPVALGFAGAAALGERIYLAGGYDGVAELADCSVYYPADDHWEACAPLILPRGGLGLAAEGNSLYAIGGGWQRTLSFNERYDSLNNTWSSIPSPIQGQWRNLGLASLGSDIYGVGGWSGDYLNVNEAYQGTFRAFLPLGARARP